MNGLVQNHHALLTVPLLTESRGELSIEFVVDTGFVGYLTLSPEAVRLLQLPVVRSIEANLADDSNILVNVHAATIRWHGEEREVEVVATGRRPLLGMLLLDGSEVSFQAADGGLLNIEPM